MKDHIRRQMVFSNYSILNNRWIVSIGVTLLIMFMGFIILNQLISDINEPVNIPMEINLTFVSEPVVSEPVVSEPVVSEPVVSEPVVSEPVVSEPVVSEPVVSEPVVSEPVVSEPVVSEPVVSEPVISEPVISEPVISEPVISEPVISEPLISEPVVSEPVVSEPVVSEPKLLLFDDISEGGTLPHPTYPKSAIKWKKQGEVEVEIHINRNGSIKSVLLLKSSGHPILDNHCIKTVKKKWRFLEQSNSVITRKRFVFKLK